MIDCRDLDFSPTLATTRIAAAQAVFGEATVRRIVAFTLFILGVNRARIAELLDIPPGTVRSLIRRLLSVGVEGFVDQRRKGALTNVTPQAEPRPPLTVHLPPDDRVLTVGGGQLRLPSHNPIQRRVVLLSLIGEGMLSVEEVARSLGLSESHVRRLHRDLLACDVDAVIDKRRGPLQDYRVDTEMKGQMIAQFVLELAECGRVSGATVARRLGDCRAEHVSERTVRYHLSNLGLNQVKTLLATAFNDSKKGSAH